jgi:hypothetical protein
MNITPHLGIGDLLIVKMLQVSNNLKISNININSQLILAYCENYEQKVKFITKLIELLFPNTTFCINNNSTDFMSMFNTYKITNSYIYNHIDNNKIKNSQN